ncbi:Uncharacterised protein [Enterobacter cloacae]|nr:Uncharacterised protein [Enterobacter cloacae]
MKNDQGDHSKAVSTEIFYGLKTSGIETKNNKNNECVERKSDLFTCVSNQSQTKSTYGKNIAA